MVQTWRFLNTGSADAAFNMALDEAMLVLHEAGKVPPTLRVYAWCCPTLSLGYAQNAAAEVNQAACQQHGIVMVRRPTGGRAVLHDQEVTYSVVLPLTLTDGPGTLTEHYHLIGVALAAALHRLGLPVQLVRPQVRGAGPRPPATAACFAALSRYELSVDGKKLVGSAQKRGQSSLLQHGSIPLWMDRHRLFQCLRVPPEQYDHLVQAAYQTMTAVNELTANPLRPEAVHAALRHSFAATCGVELVEGALQPEEWRLAQQLQRTKYASADWNIGGAAAWRAAAVASEPTPTVGGYQRA